MSYAQNPHQSATSTTMWTQPSTEEQQKYYSKHAPKRRVYGWIMTVLQVVHAFVAFASFLAIFNWVFQSIPQLAWLAPTLSIGGLFALHVLFRTTWDTYWYDKLDNNELTDSSIFIPMAIMVILLITDVNGGRMFLANQVKPIERVDAAPIDAQHATTITSLERSYSNDKAEVNQMYKEKERVATAGINRQIRIAKANDKKTGALESQKLKILAPIQAAKVAELDKAYQRYNASKGGEIQRRETAVTQVDNHNAGEISRYTNDMGNVGTYAWILSICLLTLIAALGYARVRINVKSGILPLRNYTVLDAHGSIIERFATAFGDVINRRSLQLAVWFHKILSPSRELTSFDGTVVSKPGTYNTPKGFFDNTLRQDFPQADDPEDVLRGKVFNKLVEASAKDGSIKITEQLLQEELEKARSQNGTYKFQPLGKPEPSTQTTTATVEGTPHPAAVEGPATYDAQLKHWASRVITQVNGYDTAILAGNKEKAESHQDYIANPRMPISKEAERLCIAYGVDPEQPEIMVWKIKTPGVKVPVSKLSEAALNSASPEPESQPADGEPIDLFKQSTEMFKLSILPQLNDEGVVIGVKYKKNDGEWITYPRTQVEAYARLYGERARRKPSTVTKTGSDKWQYALSLFELPAQPKNETLEAIHL